jgi:hypothetical protein
MNVDPTINLGNIIVAISGVIALVAQWSTMKNELKTMKDKATATDITIAGLATQTRLLELSNARAEEKWNQVQRSLARIEKKLFEEEP